VAQTLVVEKVALIDQLSSKAEEALIRATTAETALDETRARLADEIKRNEAMESDAKLAQDEVRQLPDLGELNSLIRALQKLNLVRQLESVANENKLAQDEVHWLR